LPQTVIRTDSTGASESMSFAYDGSMQTGITFTGTINGAIAWTFDNNFWVTSESVNGDAVNYTYDNDGRPTAVGDLTITRNWQNGFLTGTALGTIIDSYSYSTFGETASYNAKVSGASVFDVQYTRDAIGRITTKTETVGGVTTDYEYSYDVAGRLVAVKEGGVTVSTYDYDANGNRITAVTKAGTFQGFYDLQDRMTKYSDASYTYTANGELLTKAEPAGTTSYNYDVYGNLRGVTTPGGTSIEYIIDARNRRIGKKVDGALVQGFIYKDQLEPVAELDAAGNIVARFVYASKGHVPDYMIKGGVTYRIINDHLGSVRLVVNTTDSSIAQKLDYDEFGNITQDTNPGFQPFAFAGGIHDQRTNLTRFGARDYDPHTGRWTSKDPILFGGDGYSVYSYVNHSAINYVDLSGLEMTLPSDPSGLGPEWVRDKSHKDPSRERYVNKNTGDKLDWSKAKPGEEGWRGKDHYHLNEGKDHYRPGSKCKLSPPLLPSGGGTLSAPLLIMVLPCEACKLPDAPKEACRVLQIILQCNICPAENGCI